MKMLLEVRYCIVFASKTRIPLMRRQANAACLEALLGICRTNIISISCIFCHGIVPLLESHNSSWTAHEQPAALRRRCIRSTSGVAKVPRNDRFPWGGPAAGTGLTAHYCMAEICMTNTFFLQNLY